MLYGYEQALEGRANTRLKGMNPETRSVQKPMIKEELLKEVVSAVRPELEKLVAKIKNPAETAGS